MKNKATPFGMLFLVLLALPVANAAVIQTNFGTTGATTPGGAFVSAGNLLATNLSSAASTGTFISSPVLSRLYDGDLGSLGGATANSGSTVMPNVATLQFNLNGAFNLTEIRTYASWDGGRDGQSYVVKYATGATPETFNTLHTLSQFEPNVSVSSSSTLVSLTSNSGALAENVVSLQFVFNGYENGGTGFREFQVLGTPVSSVPEPSTCLPAAALVAGALLRRRRPRSHRSGRAAA